MSGKQPSKRNLRKTVLRRFENTFDLDRLHYERRTKPGKEAAKLTGLVFASVVFFAGFGLAYISHSRGVIDDMFFNKLVFLFMIPSSVIGGTAWLISSNRREFKIREDIRAHITEFEGEKGTLWRYEEALKQLNLKKVDMEGLIEASHEGRLIKMAPEDVCAAIRALHDLLSNSTTPAAVFTAIESHFSSDQEETNKG